LRFGVVWFGSMLGLGIGFIKVFVDKADDED